MRLAVKPWPTALISLLLLLSMKHWAASHDDSSMTPNAIAKRLEPVGRVSVAGEQNPASKTRPLQAVINQVTGKRIYQRICSDCHATGEVRSPRFGSRRAWLARYAKGYDSLYEHAINGFNFMPPKGTCDECADEEIKAAVRYMVEQSIPIHGSDH